MAEPLTPGEEATLRLLEEQLLHEDPALARALTRGVAGRSEPVPGQVPCRPPSGPAPSRPARWIRFPAGVLLWLGVLFLGAGWTLAVESAVVAGLVLLVGADLSARDGHSLSRLIWFALQRWWRLLK